MPLTTMSERESEFLKELKLSLMRYMIGIIFSVLTLGTAFYFSTNYRLTNLEVLGKQLEMEKAHKEIIELKLDNITKALQVITESNKEERNKRGGSK